nr:PepSY-associated TM helix domain-containing protein [Nitrosomonas sp. HPC101]
MNSENQATASAATSSQSVDRVSVSPHPAGPRGYLFLPQGMRQARFLVWLRRIHAWTGLWGAVLGLLFGTTGILLNHRSEMKIPLAAQHETRHTLTPPAESLQSPATLEAWLRERFKLSHARSRIQQKPAGPVPWGGGQIMQPESWHIMLLTPDLSLNAEYWKGDVDARIEQKEANAWATLANFHKGTGMSNIWILLTDTLAGALLVLAITGTLLWSRLHGPRLMALGLAGTVFTVAVTLIFRALSLS